MHRWGFLAGLVFGIVMLECKDLGKTIHGIYFIFLFFLWVVLLLLF